MVFSRKGERGPKKGERSELVQMLANAGTLGTQLAFSVVIGLGMGLAFEHYIDKWFAVDTRPWGMLAFLCFGIVAGFRDVVRHARAIMDADKGRDEDGPGHWTAPARPKGPTGPETTGERDEQSRSRSED